LFEVVQPSVSPVRVSDLQLNCYVVRNGRLLAVIGIQFFASV
jgi:hypothetical protein